MALDILDLRGVVSAAGYTETIPSPTMSSRLPRAGMPGHRHLECGRQSAHAADARARPAECGPSWGGDVLFHWARLRLLRLLSPGSSSCAGGQGHRRRRPGRAPAARRRRAAREPCGSRRRSRCASPGEGAAQRARQNTGRPLGQNGGETAQPAHWSSPVPFMVQVYAGAAVLDKPQTARLHRENVRTETLA
jgi:hypothetical protein